MTVHPIKFAIEQEFCTSHTLHITVAIGGEGGGGEGGSGEGADGEGGGGEGGATAGSAC